MSSYVSVKEYIFVNIFAKKKIILLTVFFRLVGNLIILVIKNPSLSLVRSLNLGYKRKVIYAFHIFKQAWE